MGVRLQPYPDYKDSGIAGLDKIPSHWEVQRLKYLLREQDSRSDDGKEQLLSVSQYTGVTQRFHKEGENRPDTRAESLVGYKRVQPSELVVNIMLAWNGSLGVSRYAGIVSPAYCVYHLGPKVDPWYIHYMLRSETYKARIKSVSTGVVESRLRLYTDDLYRLESLVPPLPEQISIVHFLDSAERHIRRYVSSRQKLIELLTKKKQLIIERAVTRGLDPNVHLRPSGIDWLGDIPEHWELRPLKRLVRNVNHQVNSKAPDEVYLSLDHIESWTGRIKLPEDEIKFESQVKRFDPGDILFGKLRPYLAKIARPDYRGVCVGELLVLRPTNDGLLPEFLEHKLRSTQVIDLVASSTFGAKMPRADWNYIGNLMIAFPPRKDEQRRIVSAIRQQASVLDVAIAHALREIELFGEYLTRLISDVATGKTDVRGHKLSAADLAGEIQPFDEGTDKSLEEGEVLVTEESMDASN